MDWLTLRECDASNIKSMQHKLGQRLDGGDRRSINAAQRSKALHGNKEVKRPMACQKGMNTPSSH